MGILKWYKRDPRAALHGMLGLSLAEKGAYNVVLDLIYLNDGQLVDDPKYICFWLGCRLPTWERLRTKLLTVGKLYIHNGHIRNEKADDEAPYAVKRLLLARESSNKRWSEYRKLKELVDAKAMTPTPTKIIPIKKWKSNREE